MVGGLRVSGYSVIVVNSNMNDVRCQSLFFISLPDLRKLCAVKVTVSSQLAGTGVRAEQRKMCRQLLLLHHNVLSSPVPGTLNQISVVMTIPFYKSGRIQAYMEKHGAIMAMPERVIPAVFQICLSYTLIAKLAPNWNQAGHLLIQGRGFLSQPGKQNAVVMNINVSETQLCISVEVCTVQLPPPELEDFDISTNILKRFDSNNNVVIQRCSISSNWCYVLPSMKMGQIISISHTIPSDSPFQSYGDLQLHWKNLYGYTLPEDPQTYCSIYFKLIGEQLFTYPFSCIRSQPVQYFPRVDLEGVLNAFVTDLKTIIPHTCGFPLKMTSKALYATKDLTQSSIQKWPTIFQQYYFCSCDELILEELDVCLRDVKNCKVNSKPTNLTGKRNCKVTLTQVITKTGMFSPSAGNIENSHKVELKVNQSEKDIFSNLSLLVEDEHTEAKQGRIYSRKQWKTPKEPALMLNSKGSVQMSKKSLKKDSTRIIPIFKGKLLQMDRQTTKAIHGKKKQNASHYSPKAMKTNPAAKLALFKCSTYQVNQPLHDASLKKNPNRSVLQMQVEKPNVNSTTFSLKGENEVLGHLPIFSFINRAVLDRNSSKIKSRRLSSSLIPVCDRSMQHASAIHQHLNKPANLSTSQSVLSTGSKKPHLYKENARTFQNQTRSPTEEAKANAYKLTNLVGDRNKRGAQKEATLEEGGIYSKPKKPRTNKPAN